MRSLAWFIAERFASSSTSCGAISLSISDLDSVSSRIDSSTARHILEKKTKRHRVCCMKTKEKNECDKLGETARHVRLACQRPSKCHPRRTADLFSVGRQPTAGGVAAGNAATQTQSIIASAVYRLPIPRLRSGLAADTGWQWRLSRRPPQDEASARFESLLGNIGRENRRVINGEIDGS